MNKKVKIIIAFIIILLLVAVALYIGLKRHNNTDVIEIREAKLYAITTEDVPILKDTTGTLWEISNLNVATEDSLLLEITNNEVTKVWVEININGDGEIPKS